jgi:hypothetical protein
MTHTDQELAGSARFFPQPARDIANSYLKSVATYNLGLQVNNGTGVGERIAGLTHQLLTKTEDPETARIEIQRIGLAFRNLSFSPEVNAFVADAFSGDLTKSKEAHTKSFVATPYLNPLDLYFLPSKGKAIVAEHFANCASNSIGISLELVRSGFPALKSIQDLGELGVDEQFLFEVELSRTYEDQRFEDGLNWGTKLDALQRVSAKRVAARYIVNCLLKLDRVMEAADFVASRALTDGGTVHLMPLKECAYKLDKTVRRKHAANLSVPIVLDLYSRYVNDELDNIRSYAYEDFLIANSVERPSQLITIAAKFNQSQLAYYLRWLCKPEIMQVSSSFKGSKDLDNERLAICVELLEIDPANSKDYESEVREITRRQVIRKGVRRIDESRIYMDVPAIRRWADKTLKEPFTRYQALLKAGGTHDVVALSKSIENVLATPASSATLPEVPKNESTELLIDMVRRLFRECMSNPEHGLDCYLSMRIRHGTLSGQLRAPLEAEKLITQREGTSPHYKPNDFWIAKLNYRGNYVAHAINEKLVEFSKSYDEVVDRFISDIVQVHSNEKPKGVFSTAVPEVVFLGIVAYVTDERPFDGFVSYCLDFFWECVKRYLDKVRDLIDLELKIQVSNLFLSLQSDLVGIVGSDSIPELDGAIRVAGTEAQLALNQVSEWFKIRTREPHEAFSIDEMIDIGLQCVKNIQRDFEPQLEKQVDVPASYIGLELYSDIFFIVFDNIRKHSGLINPKTKVIVFEKDGSTRIIVESEVSEVKRNAEVIERVERIKRTIAEGRYQRGVRSEGGTGLMKLRKIIGQAEMKSNPLGFGFRSDGRFFVELELPYVEIA